VLKPILPWLASWLELPDHFRGMGTRRIFITETLTNGLRPKFWLRKLIQKKSQALTRRLITRY